MFSASFNVTEGNTIQKSLLSHNSLKKSYLQRVPPLEPIGIAWPLAMIFLDDRKRSSTNEACTKCSNKN